MGAPEADVRSRFDDERVPDLGACGLRLVRRARVERAGIGGKPIVSAVSSRRRFDRDVLEHVPARERGEAVALVELSGVARERVEVLVVRGEDGEEAVGFAGDRRERRDVSSLVVERVGGEARLGVARAKPERGRACCRRR